MKRIVGDTVKSNVVVFGFMIILAIFIYSIHYFIFGDIKSTISGIILGLAYVPIGVLYNLLVLNKVMKKSKMIRLERRMNIVIGSFFHEIGNQLMYCIVEGDKNKERLNYLCDASETWERGDFKKLDSIIKEYECEIEIDKIDLKKLENIIHQKEDFLLDLIIGSNLDEYEGFGEMLMSMLHLRDEFDTLFVEGALKVEDIQHMRNDICKVYKWLLIFRVQYIENLNQYYPIMFMKLIKRSPFREYCPEEE